jgi:hypothetical protein
VPFTTNHTRFSPSCLHRFSFPRRITIRKSQPLAEPAAGSPRQTSFPPRRTQVLLSSSIRALCRPSAIDQARVLTLIPLLRDTLNFSSSAQVRRHRGRWDTGGPDLFREKGWRVHQSQCSTASRQVGKAARREGRPGVDPENKEIRVSSKQALSGACFQAASSRIPVVVCGCSTPRCDLPWRDEWPGL